MGQMLKEQPSAQGQSTDLLGSDEEVIPTLADLGISYDISSHARSMAAIPEEEFETVLAYIAVLPAYRLHSAYMDLRETENIT